MTWLHHELRLFFIALQFFTRIPIPAWVGFEPLWLQQCARYFPLVGAVVGGFCALVLLAALQVWPPLIASGLSLAAGVWLTGGFHEDGWADTCDGLGGAVSREKALLIMKDSRIGSYGALGLILILGLKTAAVAAWAEHSGGLAAALVVFAHCASRLAPLVLMRALPYAGDAEHAKAKPLATHIGWGGLALGCAWVLAATLAWGAALLSGLPMERAAATAWPMVAASLAALGLCCLGMARWLRRRLGGYTGDNLGASQQLSELAVLLASLAVLNAPLGQ